MPKHRRLALGTVQSQATSHAVVWALLDALGRGGQQTQHFVSRACFAPSSRGAALAGRPSRHLDTWLMSRPTCGAIFDHGMQGAELGLVEGIWSAEAADGSASLTTLADWLDLPRIAIVDVSLLSACRLPSHPAGVDAIVFDRVGHVADLPRLRTTFEALWGAPVVGWLGGDKALRRHADEARAGMGPSRELLGQLGSELAANLRFDWLLNLADRRDPPADVESRLFAKLERSTPLRVALAYDDAFYCYFPDSLDMLEARGAEFVEFSPLDDETLPVGTDVVYIGCGQPEYFAQELSENHCLLVALRDHVTRGGRLYAEGGGLAYLCQRLELPDGRMAPMSGVVPAEARRGAVHESPSPVEVELTISGWLGAAGTRLRGYRNTSWTLEPVGGFERLGRAPDGNDDDLIGRRGAIGSRVHLDFATQLETLSAFLAPALSNPRRR